MTEVVSDWVYCRVVDSGDAIWPDGRVWLGQVELSKSAEPNRSAGRALRESMSEFSLRPSETDTQRRRYARARLLLPSVSEKRALHYGDFHLRESLRLLNHHDGFGFYTLVPLGAGYLFNLRTQTASPLRPERPDWRPGGMVVTLDEGAAEPRHTLNTLLAAPKAYGELGESFRRSSHWREVGESADDDGQRLLAYWMAAECLSKENPDDDVGAKILAIAGFPGGRLAKRLPREVELSLKGDPRHIVWRSVIRGLVQRIRVARNQIVHAGYRHVDLPDVMGSEENVALTTRVLPLVVKCLGDFALHGLARRLQSVPDLWNEYGTESPEVLVRRALWFIDRLEDA